MLCYGEVNSLFYLYRLTYFSLQFSVFRLFFQLVDTGLFIFCSTSCSYVLHGLWRFHIPSNTLYTTEPDPALYMSLFILFSSLLYHILTNIYLLYVNCISMCMPKYFASLFCGRTSLFSVTDIGRCFAISEGYLWF